MGKKLVRKALDMLKTLSEESEKKQKVCVKQHIFYSMSSLSLSICDQ
jgi:hypothetical protein